MQFYLRVPNKTKVAKADGTTINPARDESLVEIRDRLPAALEGGRLAVSLDGESVTIGAEVEIKNDAGSPVPVTGPLTDAQLRAVAVPVSTGLVPLTDVQLRATPVPVSGTVAATQSGAWTEANSAAIKTTLDAVSTRLTVNDAPAPGERKRLEFPATIESGTVYVGWNASASAATSAATWMIRRIVFDANGNPSDDQVRANIAWDLRTTGWAA